ncbi:cog1565 domain containing protein [Niveomyces insectorum RCEF 264]|uniref:Protein arginine methyltransferase NDUFAF7 n=1 Tax=Niveomyces insectorum RCEF 264 TaxID=1081102 RepID=A0A167UY76_9HYPO|nr:cog1565 domain containing protein [Niveomyces insectorum RCEF 264]
MDSPVVARLFRQLFRHADCQPRRNFACLASSLKHARLRQQQPSRKPVLFRHQHHRHLRFHQHQQQQQQLRSYAVPPRRPGRVAPSNESDWQQRTDLFPPDMSAEYEQYPMVTAQDLRQRRERPRRVKMLMRDFVEDSLYNPHYGYFSKQVVIFSPGAEPFPFRRFRDEPAFHTALGQRFAAFEDELDAALVAGGGQPSATRQLWYTPTELFRPHYGEAVARYLAANYLLTSFPYHDLLVYEMGAGRGTLMLNVLDYLRAAEPAVYARTRYKIIEISESLAALQKRQLPPEYLPTRLLAFFGVLEQQFPAHRLLTSDFHALPDATAGLNAPVVQTRYERRPVPVSTPLVHQGYFDIMFPTDFGVVEALYRAVTGKLSRVEPHEAFMRQWADLAATETRSGENPLLSWYKNASVLATV